eukprot:TRINITY_DN5564_c0_g1_i5.p2 TRINITY_DN5564_c0_g1~~TRINITY_DN5564_c0_g1_i5.p2  ORF type:complete len:164 (+),score=7.60 TRINITY_DN5564_c0_g1_i5:139-630(+)
MTPDRTAIRADRRPTCNQRSLLRWLLRQAKVRRQPAQALAHVLERPRVRRLDRIGDRRADRIGALVQQLGRNGDRDGRLLPGEDDLNLALPRRRLDFRLHRTMVLKIKGVARDGARQRGKKTRASGRGRAVGDGWTNAKPTAARRGGGPPGNNGQHATDECTQ